MSTTTEKLPVTAAILAGGRSQRMGVDKTLLEIEGVAMLSRVADSLREVCGTVLVVTTRPEAAAAAELPSGVGIITDDVRYTGPLGAIATALAQAPDEWVLAVAADMPWVSPAVVRALWELHGDADVVVPRTEGGLEPLMALYNVKAALPLAQELLDAGERRPAALFDRLHVIEVPESRLREVDPQLKSLVNINTPHDLEREVPESSADASEDVRLHVIEVGTRRTRGMPTEKPITVYLNGLEIVTVQATPRDLDEFAVGFLHIEGFLQNAAAIGPIEIDARRGMIFVSTTEEMPGGLNARKRYVTSGCGRGLTFTSAGHLTNVEPVESELTVSAEQIYEMMGQMARGAQMYRDTGGIHACAVGIDGRVEIVREDIGRHNALDKALGVAWLEARPLESAVLLTSGRISSEMAIKAARVHIPIVVSRTAVTDLAAEVATELGITLVGYARGGKLVVYTHPQRVREGASS